MFSVKSNFNKEKFLKQVSDSLEDLVMKDLDVGDEITVAFEIVKKNLLAKIVFTYRKAYLPTEI